MSTEINKVIRKIKKKSEDIEFVLKHKREAKDFTRRKELRPADVIYFVLGKTGNPMDFATLAFCGKMRKEIKAPGMCKAREKLNFKAFAELFRESSKDIPAKNLYKGYRLTSYDGITGELPRTEELMSNYQSTKESQYPQFHAVAEYDVLNCVYTNAIFAPSASNERALAIELLLEHEYEGNEIFLLDRGFPSVKLIQEVEKSGKKYVMRVSKSFLKEVNEFGKIQSKDKTVCVSFDSRRKATSRVEFEGAEYSFELRCVKIDLPKGQTEILVTNLPKAEFSRSDIGEMYNYRWRIETAFLDLKYAVHVEDFMSKKENSIKQEFYASLIQANLTMLFAESANQVMLSKKNRIKSWNML